MTLARTPARNSRSQWKAFYRPLLERLEGRFALAAVANAGLDQDADRGSKVILNGSGSTGTGTLSYVWTQKSGPDVTGGLGTLNGASPEFTAPTRVTTLEFELVVSDTSEDSTPDRVIVSVLESHADALFVSPLGSDANSGTRAAPLQHIQAAIAKADAQGDDVYVAAGVYSESISLATGVSVYGGFDADTWLRNPTAYVTTISGGPTAVQGSNVQNIILDGITIISADGTVPGSSSTAVVLVDASNVELSGDIIKSGNGAIGMPGVAGQNAPSLSAAQAGASGELGCGGCSTKGDGGPGGTGATAGSGGKGGNGAYRTQLGGSGAPGTNGSDPNGVPGPGGTGGTYSGSPGSRAGNGGRGNDAITVNGTAGQGATTVGTINSTGVYVPMSGSSGSLGTNGGGGGGGGGGGSQYCTFCIDDQGGGGGGGGAGGLRAPSAGGGGGGGGASIAIVLVNSSAISIHDNKISTGSGGNGGSGGAGGRGQPGGAGGTGGGGVDDSGSGGNGGNGAAGGASGPGGGGSGGPATGIDATATTGASANNVLTIGTAGVGGAGGTSSVLGAAPNGTAGIANSVRGGFASLPNVVTLDAKAIAENQPAGTSVGGLNTNNSTAGTPFSYELVAGLGDDNNNSFKISGSQLVANFMLDFEARAALSVRVRSTDAGNVSVEKVFSIDVSDVNDPPTCRIGPPQQTNDEAGLQTVNSWIKNCQGEPGANSTQHVEYELDVDNPNLFQTQPNVTSDGKLTYQPARNVRGTATITITITDGGGTESGGVDQTIIQVPFEVQKLYPWQNSKNHNDVNDDGSIAADDVVDVINQINAKGAGVLPQRTVIAKPYYDADNDKECTANDVVKIINYINAHPGESEGEASSGEAQGDATTEELLLLLATDSAGQIRTARRLR